jgi:hypothetical protein
MKFADDFMEVTIDILVVLVTKADTIRQSEEIASKTEQNNQSRKKILFMRTRLLKIIHESR